MSAISELQPGLASVIMPMRNAMRHLPAAMHSLQRQTYPSLEIVAIDDGSEDGTREYLESVPASNLRICSTDAGNRGIVAALNVGLANARGEYIVRHDADDLSHPKRVERQVAFLLSHPSVDVVASCAEFIDENGKASSNSWTMSVRRTHDMALTPGQIAALLPLTCCLIHGSVACRTGVLVEAGCYRPEFEWAEDYDLWLRLLPRCQFAKLRQRLYTYRIHSNQLSGSRRNEQLNRTVRAKLGYVRRVARGLPIPARVLIQGEGVGAVRYREALHEFGMIEVPRVDPACRTISGDWDLFIVTDFDLIDAYGEILANPSRLGNFFLHI